MLKLIDNLDGYIFDTTFQALRELGYGKHVLDDELQAYFSTSTVGFLHDRISEDITKQDIQPFKEVFKKFYKKGDCPNLERVAPDPRPADVHGVLGNAVSVPVQDSHLA